MFKTDSLICSLGLMEVPAEAALAEVDLLAPEETG